MSLFSTGCARRPSMTLIYLLHATSLDSSLQSPAISAISSSPPPVVAHNACTTPRQTRQLTPLDHDQHSRSLRNKQSDSHKSSSTTNSVQQTYNSSDRSTILLMTHSPQLVPAPARASPLVAVLLAVLISAGLGETLDGHLTTICPLSVLPLCVLALLGLLQLRNHLVRTVEDPASWRPTRRTLWRLRKALDRTG